MDVTNRLPLNRLPRLSQRTKMLLKWGVLIVIAFLAVQTVGLDSIRDQLSQFSLGTVLIALALGAVSRALYSLRWGQIAVGVGGRAFSLVYRLRVDLLGEFVSIVVPSYLGADGVRLLHLQQRGEKNAIILLSILFDRIVGVVTLGLLTAAFLPAILPYIQFDLSLLPYLLIGGAIMAAVGLIAGIVLYRRWRSGKLKLPDMLVGVRINARPLVAAVIISLVGHACFAAIYFVLFQALLPVDFALIMAITLLALLTRTIPVSILGVEVSDGSIVVLAGLIGIESPAALAVVALILGSRYFFALCGMVIEFLADGRKIYVPRNNAD